MKCEWCNRRGPGPGWYVWYDAKEDRNCGVCFNHDCFHHEGDSREPSLFVVYRPEDSGSRIPAPVEMFA